MSEGVAQTDVSSMPLPVMKRLLVALKSAL